MRKFFILGTALLLSAAMQAQTVVNSDGTEKEINTPDVTGDRKTDQPQSFYDVTAIIPDGGWGLQYEMGIGHVFFGGGYAFGKTNDVVTTNNFWNILAGGHYSYWITNSFYIDGRVGIGYGHTKMEFKGGGKASDGDVYLHFSPHVGLLIGKSWGITAGYGWNFTKFKFDKEHKGDYFIVGITGRF